MKKQNTKLWLSIISFGFAILFGIAGFCCPPLSIIDSSVLYFTGQLFLFTATILGVNVDFSQLKKPKPNEME